MTYKEARDYIYGIFHAVWDSSWPVAWGDLPAAPPSNDTAWARVRLLHTNGGQSTLCGESGSRRFARRGIVTISIFVPVGGGAVGAGGGADLLQGAGA